MNRLLDGYSMGSPDDGQDGGNQGRKQRGMEIAALSRIERHHEGYKVPSQSGNRTYMVRVEDKESCTCPDFEQRRSPCKHIYAVWFTIQRENLPNNGGPAIATPPTSAIAKPTYPQDWTAYNAAQTSEKRMLMDLLSQLCSSVRQPAQGMGRPRALLSDMVYASVFKVYSMFSTRRFTSDIHDAYDKGFVTHPPHFNTVIKYMSDPSLTPVLIDLITASSLPLKPVETNFAVDSSGFSTSRFVRWFNKKYGREVDNREWVKCHLMAGVNTGIVTSVEISGWEAHDTNYFKPLLERTAQYFDMEEVYADKAYSSRNNMSIALAAKVVPYIPFKSNTVERRDGSSWARLYHYFRYNQEDFMAHYHRRSNVETTFSVIKTKFGDAIRSKNTIAQVNEVLCKVLCHNIAVVINAVFTRGIEPILCAGLPPAHKGTVAA